MRDPADILLVSCYELGHQPASLAWPCAFLRQAGFAPGTVDLAVEEFPAERIAAARLIAIAVPMHTALRLGVRVAARARALNPDVHICFYGVYAGLNRDVLLAGDADTVLAAESEAALVRLARRLAGDSPAAVPAATGPERLRFVVPARDSLPTLDRYGGLVDGEHTHRAGYVEASRGCKHHCRHCPLVPVYDGRFFAVPVDVVLADAAQQIAAGARHLTFGDPDFLNGPGHAVRIIETLGERFPDVTFDFTAKVEHLLLHRDAVARIAKHNCAFVVSAFESRSDRVLTHLAKGHDRADLDRVVDWADRIGLHLRPTLVPFTPWSDLEDLVELLDWLTDRDLIASIDPIQLTIRLLVPPHSRLLDLPPEPGWPGPLDDAGLTHRWRHSDPRVDALQLTLAARVEQAVRSGEDPDATFAALRDLTYQAAGRLPEANQIATDRAGSAPPPARRQRPPHLAEAWFC